MSIDLVDTHCHLNITENFPEPGPFIEAASAAGVGRLILIGLDLPTSERAVELAEEHENVFAVVGHHPNYAADYSSSELGRYQSWLSHPKVVALGEMGLDFHWDYATREQQERCLREQLDLAQDTGSPVVFHCRDAYADLLNLLEKREPGPFLFHCFSGDGEDARRALALGCSFGFDGPLTYKNNEGLRALVRDLPREKVVIETDSPYLTPEPHRGKPNQPAYLPFVNTALARLWGVTEEESGRITTENAERFFPKLC